MRTARFITLVIVVCILVSSVQAATSTATARVVVIIAPEQMLIQQGDDILLKIRLSPGATARVWVDSSCEIPNSKAVLILQSGSYVLPIEKMQGLGGSYSCLRSSDGRLTTAVQIVPRTRP